MLNHHRLAAGTTRAADGRAGRLIGGPDVATVAVVRLDEFIAPRAEVVALRVG
ncbi:hypothetical protein ACFPM0_05085 [Pseudonocardia sulfidoxydans]